MTIHRVKSTDGVELALHDFGGTGPPLLILHATGFHANCYAAIAEQLTDIRRIYAPDLRGHGDSFTPDIALPWSKMVDDVVATLHYLNIDEPVDMVGHSMGGATALATELRRPGTLRRAWVYEPIVFPPDAEREQGTMSATARNRRSTFESLESAYQRYASRPPFDAIEPRVLRDYVEHGFRDSSGADPGEVVLKCTPESEGRVFDGVDESIFGQLNNINAEVWVVGSGDGGTPSMIAAKAASELRRSTFVHWTDRTHFGPFEDPSRAARDIRAAIT